ncbi:glucose-6-phosphate isomerase family protein [Geosporobacter ferrireducens]|uniref:glucose-6-phosphate isomerase n=1 Tax=Geosporobacter ferrireducens TaxID=1424294 RepID=A0A1D8GKM0_9FIRM|nr:glucose-6-phosphate isomerase family protein [Geosporobacter ferrireducens]AOT71454.1 hypothetical protein Gferi_19120 [Geosporobacter ferrireducens]MTI57760.1 glucose-6-phosphate isomerase [Geosporobacter ferrireducens]
MQIKSPKYIYDFFNGVIQGENVKHYKKLYKEIDFIYKTRDNQLSPDTVMYEVYSFNEGGSNILLWGLTVIYPITINGECNMTRGHFHEDREEPEIYFGCSGEGLLLYLDSQGKIFAEKVFKGSLHYIHGNYAHRLVNTGDDTLRVGACWREAAGHDYKSIDEKPFPNRVYKKDGKIDIA